MPDENHRRMRRRNIITALVLAAVAIGFYIAIYWSRAG